MSLAAVPPSADSEPLPGHFASRAQQSKVMVWGRRSAIQASVNLLNVWYLVLAARLARADSMIARHMKGAEFHLGNIKQIQESLEALPVAAHRLTLRTRLGVYLLAVVLELLLLHALFAIGNFSEFEAWTMGGSMTTFLVGGPSAFAYWSGKRNHERKKDTPDLLVVLVAFCVFLAVAGIAYGISSQTGTISASTTADIQWAFAGALVGMPLLSLCLTAYSFVPSASEYLSVARLLDNQTRKFVRGGLLVRHAIRVAAATRAKLKARIQRAELRGQSGPLLGLERALDAAAAQGGTTLDITGIGVTTAADVPRSKDISEALFSDIGVAAGKDDDDLKRKAS